jgi:LacI family transcriptional regulator/LacI family repressor for deo operon, udp, cdd, tsx, nupC, and nupG
MLDKKRSSIEDIAEAADVSIATVSRVLNKSTKVREETAQRVLAAAKDLNYRPDRVARRMRVKGADSLALGLIITDVGNPFYSDLVRGVEDVAYKHKQAVMICNTDENPEKEKFYIDSMLAEKVSGLIIAPSKGNVAYFKELKDNNYPLVCVDRHPDGLNIDTVTIDNEKGAWLAVKRLIDLGHTRIGIVNGIKGVTTTEGRFAGYKKALKQAGLPLEDSLISFENYKESGGRDAMRKFLALDNPPTAVFSTNNLMTLGCFEELHEQNIKIPDEIAIIGFDDMPWSIALSPPLTAVKQPGYELGMNAAELLLKRLNHPDRNSMNMVLNSELIIRKSCGSKIG